MKIVRFGPAGMERPGILDRDGRIRDASDIVGDWSGEVLDRLNGIDWRSLPLAANQESRLGIPVAGIGKYVCIGMNYSDHAAENGLQPPREPILFLKANSALCGAYDPLILPRGAEKTDWEVELGVVIGRAGKYVPEEAALDHVAGYVTVNDISDRSFQIERAGQWTKGKSADTFGPVGPWLVTRDEVADPQNLSLRLWHNSELRQNGTTQKMIFSVARIVSYLSEFMSLHPGDVIATGSPPGVGMGHRPQIFLKPGDVIEAEVQGLGRQTQLVKAEA